MDRGRSWISEVVNVRALDGLGGWFNLCGNLALRAACLITRGLAVIGRSSAQISDLVGFYSPSP